jgi:hypothetical protein
MRKLLLVLFLFIIASHGFAQQAYNVTGIVRTAEGKKLAGATIAVPSLQKSVVTDSEGKFRISVPAGTTNITVRFIGYETTLYKLDPQKSLH